MASTAICTAALLSNDKIISFFSLIPEFTLIATDHLPTRPVGGPLIMALEIVVGVDFGTTHTGVSWAINGGTKRVRLIDDWPKSNSSIENTEKVPTKISYDGREPLHWGYNVTVTEQSFKWFKLLLDPHRAAQVPGPVVSSERLLGSLNKTAEQVAADYLKQVWNYTTNDIARSQGDGWQSRHPLRVVLTVPAIWSPAAKDRTLKAARAAGLPENLSLVSEPEAAALRVLREKNQDQTVQKGDCFVVCDAGGGTVDLISYKVISLDPFSLEECATGDGGLCGSVYLDIAFERYISALVGESQYSTISEKKKKRMLGEFEMLKRSFDGEGQRDYSVDLQGVEDNPKSGIDDGTILLGSSALRTLFDHVINQIMNLVQKQISEVEEAGLRVKAILLVGGFGASKYMYKRLQEAYVSKNIQTLQVNGAWSSICTGATLWGLENSSDNASSRRTVQSRISRHSYGLCFTLLFDKTKGHLETDRFRGTKGEWRAREQMGWLLRKGDQVREGRSYDQDIFSSLQVGWSDSGTQDFSETLYYCADDEPPSRREPNVKELCTVEYGVDKSKLWLETSYKNPETKKKWRDASFNFQFAPGSASIAFSVYYKNQRVAYTRANYADDS